MVMVSVPSPASRSRRQGPGAYLQTFVASSLTTSCASSIAREVITRPCVDCASARNSRAKARARAIPPEPMSYATPAFTADVPDS